MAKARMNYRLLYRLTYIAKNLFNLLSGISKIFSPSFKLRSKNDSCPPHMTDAWVVTSSDSLTDLHYHFGL